MVNTPDKDRIDAQDEIKVRIIIHHKPLPQVSGDRESVDGARILLPGAGAGQIVQHTAGVVMRFEAPITNCSMGPRREVKRCRRGRLLRLLQARLDE